jgi:hypothetical protein
MPDSRKFDDQEAARRRRAWLHERHAQARELVVVLLRHAPEAEVARVLDQLPPVTCNAWLTCSLRSTTRTTTRTWRRPAGPD